MIRLAEHREGQASLVRAAVTPPHGQDARATSRGASLVSGLRLSAVRDVPPYFAALWIKPGVVPPKNLGVLGVLAVPQNQSHALQKTSVPSVVPKTRAALLLSRLTRDLRPATCGRWHPDHKSLAPFVTTTVQVFRRLTRLPQAARRKADVLRRSCLPVSRSCL